MSSPSSGASPAAEGGANFASILEACWRAFDATVADAPAELSKGPRGGGRDRDRIAAHLLDAERAYARKLGVRLPPRTPIGEHREALLETIRHDASSGAWPARYAVRRIAWHVLDHRWEIEDRSA